MHNLNAQPNLSEALQCKRFKGCYLLESVKIKISKTGWPVRIATIRDLQSWDYLELRLLGNNFLAINHFVGDYVQLEAAIKRYKSDLFYYLAWYEPVTGFLMESSIKTQSRNVIKQVSRDACLQSLRNRILLFLNTSEQSFCFDILKNFSDGFSTYAIKNLCEKLPSLSNNQLIVELACLMEKYGSDISSIGHLLNQLENKRPYREWEQKLLGE